MESSQTYEPLELFVDTSLEYEIDRSRFPGIDNGQPMLLIHLPTDCPCRRTESTFTDHELYRLIDTLEGMTSDEEQPSTLDFSNTFLMTSPDMIPWLYSSPSDRLFPDEHAVDTTLPSPDFLSDILTTLPSFSSFPEADLSGLWDNQFYPHLNKTEEWLDECFLNDVPGTKRKRRHSTVHEEFTKRRKIEPSLVTEILEAEAEIRMGL